MAIKVFLDKSCIYPYTAFCLIFWFGAHYQTCLALTAVTTPHSNFPLRFKRCKPPPGGARLCALRDWTGLTPHPEGDTVSKEDMIELQGVVIEMLPESRYRVRLDNNVEILAYGSGKMKMHRIRVLVGDRVTVEMSPYDLTKGRINFRHPTAKMEGLPPAKRRY
jgi:translation initiation factor IF-1